jgi:anti-sigma-K factor RskA
VPERQTLAMRGWLMEPLNGSGVYQAWAVEAGGFRSLGMADSVAFAGFTLVAERDLSGVQRIVITIEPPGGSLVAPRGPVIVEMVPGI